MNSKFLIKVFSACKKVPKGKVTTYKEIAININSPRSYRAVGNALNKNTDTKNIPCHRVVKSNGEIGGYAFGVKKKISKLNLEGISIENGKINLDKYLFRF